ncbi:hypothetical protein PpBr36_02255 [Pyricularia pennisetigena]|uniref:hypothetical protein n=1 Tax=Pyricularia pennisetigena TaxID=1578925 RepID=UPI00114E01BD|nr:hypothetical protein PpBr36_02255 [Pyricularia pennisetigena]TLS30950.1 hypothetical protein PpBr36_02255 [Pyricularia pennisetigena]
MMDKPIACPVPGDAAGLELCPEATTGATGLRGDDIRSLADGSAAEENRERRKEAPQRGRGDQKKRAVVMTMIWHDRDGLGTLLSRSARRKSRRHTTAITPQHDDTAHVRPSALTPEHQARAGLLLSRIGRAFCPRLKRRGSKPTTLPIDDVPRLRFDDCHHEVHITGGVAASAAAAAVPVPPPIPPILLLPPPPSPPPSPPPPPPPTSRPTSQAQPPSRQRRTSLLGRARKSCLEKLDDARLARRCCCISVAGRLSGRCGGGMSRLKTSTSCRSNTPWSSSTNMGVAESGGGGGGGGGWALEIYFAMEFEVQSEPRPDPDPQGQGSGGLQGVSSVGSREDP